MPQEKSSRSQKRGFEGSNASNFNIVAPERAYVAEMTDLQTYENDTAGINSTRIDAAKATAAETRRRVH